MPSYDFKNTALGDRDLHRNAIQVPVIPSLPCSFLMRLPTKCLQPDPYLPLTGLTGLGGFITT